MEQKKKENKRKGNIYDRIFKENAQELFLPLVEKKLAVKIISYEALPEKVQKTTEREADFLYKVKTNKKKQFLLHIEFQNKNDPEMLARMQEYHGLFHRKYKLPMHHVVIYLGKRKPTMRNQMREEEIFRGFDLISIYEMNPEDFLSSQVPSVIMLALLTKFKRERTEAVLRLVLTNIKKQANQENDLKKYLEQLLILARIRNLENVTEKIIEDMPITYDIEKDGLYKKGVLKGIEQGSEKNHEQTLLAINYLKEGKTIKEIVVLTGLAEKKVKELKEQIF